MAAAETKTWIRIRMTTNMKKQQQFCALQKGGEGRILANSKTSFNASLVLVSEELFLVQVLIHPARGK